MVTLGNIFAVFGFIVFCMGLGWLIAQPIKYVIYRKRRQRDV